MKTTDRNQNFQKQKKQEKQIKPEGVKVGRVVDCSCIPFAKIVLFSYIYINKQHKYKILLKLQKQFSNIILY
jgi:hypothetical protein